VCLCFGFVLFLPMEETTFIMIKPDGVQRRLVAPIIARFENRGLTLVAIKMVNTSEALIDQHYAELVNKPFYPGLKQYMLSGPVIAMVWKGKAAAALGRAIVGATNPKESAPGTIRGDFCNDVGRNVIHASDSVESAKREIALWFKPEELVHYVPCDLGWVYENVS
jgi:nucleoside-diphosphate kinase